MANPAAWMHWAVTDIDYEELLTDVKISVTTDKACHLYMKWKDKPPFLRKVVKWKRGIKLLCDIVYSFRKPNIKNQTEAGDTLIHTFVLGTWWVCTTRWFYLYGVVSGWPTASKSPFFQHHHTAPPYGPPVTVKFYPTIGHTGIAADGWSRRAHNGDTWIQIRDGAGTNADDVTAIIMLGIYYGTPTGRWSMLTRGFLHFDTHTIPVGSLIQAATAYLKPESKGNTSGWSLNFCLVWSNDPTPNIITPTDYNLLSVTPIAPVKTWAQMVPGTYAPFVIDPDYYDMIVPGGVTKLGIRDYTYDALNHAPVWASGAYYYLYLYSIETAIANSKPYLEVTYRPPA